jgi:hypothetical protein
MKTLAVLFAATAIAAMPTPAAAQYGPPPIGGPIGAILDWNFWSAASASAASALLL